MPTYVCYTRPGALDPGQKAALAKAITEAHSDSTGAPQSFVQCIFREFGDTDHFIGGQPVRGSGVWIFGHIRSGRTLGAKRQALVAIKDAVCHIAGVSPESVWIYLNELFHTDMIEFGEVLPPNGAETVWIEALPAALRERLIALD
jgi:phenylpyruvate tautomerase PptA (4-oxalocrotonate tautomerase family)